MGLPLLHCVCIIKSHQQLRHGICTKPNYMDVFKSKDFQRIFFACLLAPTDTEKTKNTVRYSQKQATKEKSTIACSVD